MAGNIDPPNDAERCALAPLYYRAETVIALYDFLRADKYRVREINLAPAARPRAIIKNLERELPLVYHSCGLNCCVYATVRGSPIPAERQNNEPFFFFFFFF